MLEKITIENFLSINEQQELKITNRLTTLIGQNAVGKSSVLKAIEKLNGIKINKKEKNINQRNKETIISAKFRITSSKIKEKNRIYKKQNPDGILSLPDKQDLIYELKLNEEGKLKYLFRYADTNRIFSIDVHFLNLVLTQINNIIKKTKNKELINALKFSISNILEYNNLIEALPDNLKELITGELRNRMLSFVKEYTENKDFFVPKYKFVYMNSFKDLLIDEISVDSIEMNSTVLSFLKIAEVTPDEIRQALDTGDNQTIQTITNKTVEVVTNHFRKIFSQVSKDEKFRISMNIDSVNKKLCFWVQNNMTDQAVIPFSEESEGMQWYLSMYLKLYEYLEKKDENVNYILLLDEPNIYLHAAAQNDLLNKVFKDKLRDIQIIYSTHSPYMINSEDLFSLRIIDKKDQTYIYNNTVDYLKDFKKGENLNDIDVLSPVLFSIGISINNQLIPDSKDKIIIVEGPHDFYMLNTMLKVLKLSEKGFKIIPCNGASKVPFMSGYLYGMGYKIIALLDDDTDGRKAMNSLKYLDDSESYIHCILYQKENCEKNVILEDMFSSGDRKKFMSVKSTVNYRKIYDNSDNIEFDDETINNFKYLFDLLESKF